jgi:hypothetical protein
VCMTIFGAKESRGRLPDSLVSDCGFSVEVRIVGRLLCGKPQNCNR